MRTEQTKVNRYIQENSSRQGSAPESARTLPMRRSDDLPAPEPVVPVAGTLGHVVERHGLVVRGGRAATARRCEVEAVERRRCGAEHPGQLLDHGSSFPLQGDFTLVDDLSSSHYILLCLKSQDVLSTTLSIRPYFFDSSALIQKSRSTSFSILASF